MLDNFLEANLQHKLKLLSVLHTNRVIDQHALEHILDLGPTATRTLIEEINDATQGMASIHTTPDTVTLYTEEGVYFFHLFRAICKQSSVLRCLRFLLLNDNHRPFSRFIEDAYLTKSSAYRARQACVDYLHCIGLEIENNGVIGREYRIRFLMGLLHYKYGIDCYDITAEDLRIVRRFILATNHVVDAEYLEQTENEYGYFEYLLTLAWKRKDHPLSPVLSDQLDALKELFLFDAIKDAVQQHLTPALSCQLNALDLDYIYLVFCCTNNCLFQDRRDDDATKAVTDIVFADPAFSDLLRRIGDRFGKEVAESHALRVALVYFYKKCLLELQCIIPDKNFFVDTPQQPLSKAFLQYLTDFLNDWREVNHIQYRLDSNHLIFLSLQIEYILRQTLPPVPVYILSDLFVDLDVLALHLSRQVSDKRIDIHTFLLNGEDHRTLTTLENCVVIAHKKFEGILTRMGIAAHNTLIPITAELNNDERAAIHLAINHYDDAHFATLIQSPK